MNQIDTYNAAKSLIVIGKVLFWMAGILLFVALMMLLSKEKSVWVFLVPPSFLMWLSGCFFRGMVAIIFNQVKNNELLEAMRNKA